MPFFSYYGLPTAHSLSNRSRMEMPLLKGRFIYTEKTHIEQIIRCTTDFKNALTQLEKIDFELLAGFTAGFIGFTFSFLPWFSVIAGAGFMLAFCSYRARPEAEANYKIAIQNLKDCCEWSIGKKVIVSPAFKTALSTENELRQELERMVSGLSPIMTTQQLKAIIHDELVERQEELLGQARKGTIKFHFMDKPLSKRQLGLYYHIYGYEQVNPGSTLALTKLIEYIVKKCLNLFQSRVSEPEDLIPDSESSSCYPCGGMSSS